MPNGLHRLGKKFDTLPSSANIYFETYIVSDSEISVSAGCIATPALDFGTGPFAPWVPAI
jgi:hypothetical protein